MVLNVVVGQFTKDATNVDNATQDVSLSFTPLAVIVWGIHQQTTNSLTDGHATYSLGFSDGTNQRCFANSEEDAAASEETRKRYQGTQCIQFLTVATDSVEAEADITFATDKFTVTWTINDSVASLINYIAFGGSDITGVQVGQFAKTTNTSPPVSQSVTLDSDVQNISDNEGIIFFMGTIGGGTGFIRRSLIPLGAATSASNYGYLSTESDDGTAVGECYQQYSQSKCLVHYSISTTVLAECDFTGWTATGFDINWTTQSSVTAYKVFFLVIKGGRWECGNETASTSATTKATTTLFEPKALITIAGNRTTEGITRQDKSFSVGAADGSNEVSSGYSGEDGDTTTFKGTWTDNTKTVKIIAQGTGAPTIDGEADLDSLNATDFTLDWTNAAAAAYKFLWVVMADTPTKTFTMDIIIQKQSLSKTFTMDIILEKPSLTKTFTMDIILQKEQTKTFTMDIILKKSSLTKTFTMDIILQKETTKTFTMDIVLQKPSLTKTFTMDIVISLFAARTKTFTIDIFIIRTPSTGANAKSFRRGVKAIAWNRGVDAIMYNKEVGATRV